MQPGQLRLESFFSNPACLSGGTSDGPQEGRQQERIGRQQQQERVGRQQERVGRQQERAGRQQERAGRQQQLLDPVSMCEDMRSYPPPAVRREKLRVFLSTSAGPLPFVFVCSVPRTSAAWRICVST